MSRWYKREYIPKVVNEPSREMIRKLMGEVEVYGKENGLEITVMGFDVKFTREMSMWVELRYMYNGEILYIEREYLNEILPAFVSWVLYEKEQKKE